MRVFLATLGTETNTFASVPTGIDDFRRGLWVEKGAMSIGPNPWIAPAQKWVQRAEAAGWEVVESLHAFAEPAGVTVRSAYEQMRDRILADLKAAGPVDAVLMFLHGAMIADGYDDCEADFVERMRAQVGPGVKIGIELDLHAHMDHRIIDAADIIVIYKAYPHIDYAERADDLFTLMERTLKGEIDPVMALFDCKVMGLFPTTREGPMVQFVADMFAAEGKDGVLSLSLNHGFPWADLPIAGAKMLAVADGDRALAERTAEAFGRKFYDVRTEATLPFVPLADAIAEAKKRGDKPLLLADTSDQTGGGAPGDTTYMLKALIDAGITNAVYGPLWDPLAVGICFAVGVGATLPMRIGGKFAPHSGPSLDVEAEVLHLARDSWQDQLSNEKVPIGDIAVIRVSGIEIVMSTRRFGVFSPTLFTRHGITLDDKQVIGLKNLYRHRDVFAPLVREQLFVATPGACPPDWVSIPFKRVPRPIWPLDPDPLG
ncbi:MAG: M81 family peptidase [Hyphomicrobiales bacterium]|nr:MAG: M81 family peptidase [Hyphomicrobiales bacterium]